MKKRLSFAFFSLFCAGCVLFAASCKSDSDETADSVESVVSTGGIIAFYSPGGLGDNSYVDAICYGVHATALKNNLAVYDISPADWNEAKTLVDEYIPLCYNLAKDNAMPVLFLFADAGYADYLSAHTAAKPATLSFLLFDAKTESADTVLNTAYLSTYGVNYLAGVASKALLSETENPRVLSLLANETSPSVQDAVAGFVQGYGAAWDKKTYGYEFLAWSDAEGEAFKAANFAAIRLSNDTDASGYNSASLAYGLAIFAQKETPFDLYFPVCGGSVHGLLRYNREKGTDSFYTVGMDTDLSVYTAQVPFSVIKHVDYALQTCVEQWKKHTLPHHQVLSLADGYTELVISKKLSASLSEKVSAAVQEARATAIAKESEYEQQN